jgi:hypothetical protein
MSPSLGVRFQVGANGEPQFIDQGGHRHYKVVFEIENLPEGVYAATFELDPTYFDPVRTLRPDENGRIRLEVNAYGDYDVNVRLRTREGEVRVRGNLYRELQRSCQEMKLGGPAIEEALADIAAN